MGRTVYIDGDVLMYRAAFAAEVSRWGLVERSGECYITADTKERALDIAIGYPECSVEKVCEPLPFNMAKVKYREDIKSIMKGTGCSNYKIFITHQDRTKNVRYKWAVTHPYKGNRKAASPYHKDAVYDYMVLDGAEVVSGIEADDALGCAIFNNPRAVCASIDKDLWMIPGEHYDIVKGTRKKASDPGTLELVEKSYGKKLVGTGFKWFCAQMLMGDSVDNIKGLHRYGDVKAYGLLDGFTDIEDMWDMVILQYAAMEQSPERLLENANLLWIQRQPGQLFEDWEKANLL
jgi:hypothetical protein